MLESAWHPPRGIRILARHETALDPERDQPEDLVARIQARDRSAEERVAELYGRGVAVILDRHTGGRPEAEDLFQDTFRVALEKLRNGELREPAKLPVFLAQIARNLAIEHYRKATRRKTDTDSEVILDVPSGSAGPLAALLNRENAVLVRRVLQELGNERDRQILLRFYIAEEDKDRISADYGLTSLQFNRVLHRARQRYKTLFLGRGEQGAALTAGAIIVCLITLWRWVLRGAGA
jgi:RNA polymerase sigma-70 factor, ECF subfamily